MAVEEGDDLQLFQLTKVASASNVSFTTFSAIPGRQLIALTLQCGNVLLYSPPTSGAQGAVRCIPWFEGSKKNIQAATFDPTFGIWLLVACFDGSLHIVPTLFPLQNSNASLDSLDCDWSFEDITSLPPLCSGGKLNDLVPTALAWWDRLDSEGRCRSIVIVGGNNGEIILANMLSGCLVGRTNIDGSVASIQVCKDDSPLDSPPIFLLITNENRKQWKLVLEDRETSYSWPFPHEPTRTDSTTSLMSGAGSEESAGRPSMTSFPLARARLQGLKQLSVEKLATLRQKLTETRNRGLNVTLKRRGSSSSEESISRHRSSTVSSDSDSLSVKTPCDHHNNGSPRIIPLNETFLCLQMSRGKRLLTGYYAPAQLFTVYGLALNMIPLSVHKLACTCGFILLTDWLLYTTDINKKHLSVTSYRMSQCRLDGDKQILNSDLNPDSVLQEFEFPEGEEIQALYRVTPTVQDRQEQKELLEEKEVFNSGNPHLNKKGGSGLAEQSPLDQCTVITNKGIYKITMRKAPRELVLACVLEPNKIERAERLCQMFGLDLQQLVETAAKRQLEKGQLPSALSLYKLARCRPVKSVLHMASAGYTEQLLYLTTTLLQSGQLQSEGLHLANLSILTFTEQYLRRKNLDGLSSHFKTFLKDNQHYDEVLAVSVIGQSGLCSILNFLCDQRGLYTQVLDVLSRIINCQHIPKLDCELCDGFWECLSNEMLCQSLVANPDIAKLHLQFIGSKIEYLDEKILQRFATLYDPSQPCVRPALQRLMLDFSDTGSTNSFNDNLGQDDGQFLLSDWLAGYFVICFYLSRSRRKTKNLFYNTELKSDLPTNFDHVTNSLQTKEGLNGMCNIISAGNTHVALVRNGYVYVWGNATNGCLGIGPTLSQSITPTQVPFFPLLGIQVSSVACGKSHTIALTDNGVYSWGSSKYGQLGVGPTNQSPEPRLVEKLYNEKIILVVAGQYHSLALTSDGRLYTWGWGVHGQLGHNNVEDCHYPRWVQALSSEVCVSCSGGHAHSLVLTSSGRVWAFGSSVFGQLGTGSNAKSSHPVQVFGLPEKISAIATAYFHNLALATSNRLYTWGSSPQVLRLQAQAQKKARVQYHQQQQSLSKETGRTVEETGDNCQLSSDIEMTQSVNSDKDESSDNEADSNRKKPHLKILQSTRFTGINSEMVVSPSTEFKGLPSGKIVTEQTTSTFTSENRAITSGSLVGIDDGLSHLSPTLVDTSHVEGKITQINCGCHHSALLTEKGHVYTWGRNLDAQLGNGARVKEALYPTHITIGNNVELQSIVCGGDFTVGVEAGGRVWGWGSNQQAQLGRPQIEETTRAGLEGCLFMLKTSKRVIKLPHGSLNTIDTPKEVPSLPAVKIEFPTLMPDLKKLKSLQYLSLIETPPHDYRTLHYALSYFHGYYDTSIMQEKCVELEDFHTAAKLATLDKQYDVAMGYQLKAAMAKNECLKGGMKLTIESNGVKDNLLSLKEKASKIVVSTDVIVPTLETSLTVNSEIGRKIGLTRARSNCDVFKAQNDDLLQKEAKNDDQSEFSDSSQDKFIKIDDFSEDKSNSEIHTFAIQGGTEEMSTQSQDTIKSENRSDDILDSRSETPDTLASSCCDEFGTKSSEIFDSPVKHFTDKEIKQNLPNVSPEYENIVHKHIKDLESNQELFGNVFESDTLNNELVEDLAKIVEFYMVLCERGPKTSLNALLKQGLEFWTNHKLPVCRLEALLLSHWSLVSYPLGVLLLGNDAEICFNAQQVLSHLSTDFSLQLCSAMVHHTTDKENSYPEMVELLSGLSWSEQTSARLAGRTGQLNLDQVISQINSAQQSQPYIDLDLSTDINEDLTVSSSGEVISFSCGHRYNGSSSLNKEALGAARRMDDRSLPNTAQALRSLFQQPLVVRHFACPTCILGCVQSELE